MGDGPEQPLTFPTDVVFCRFSRSSKRSIDEGNNSDKDAKRGKADDA